MRPSDGAIYSECKPCASCQTGTCTAKRVSEPAVSASPPLLTAPDDVQRNSLDPPNLRQPQRRSANHKLRAWIKRKPKPLHVILHRPQCPVHLDRLTHTHRPQQIKHRLPISRRPTRRNTIRDRFVNYSIA